jgi:hypothetical protein
VGRENCRVIALAIKKAWYVRAAAERDRRSCFAVLCMVAPRPALVVKWHPPGRRFHRECVSTHAALDL